MGDFASYLLALLVTFTGVFAYYSVVEDNIIRFSSLAFILVGHIFSYLFRESKNRKFYSNLILICLVFLLVMEKIKGSGVLLSPIEARGEIGLIVGAYLLWLVVMRSFTLFNTNYLAFSIIPSMGFLGLICSYNVNPEMFLYILLFFLSSVLLLCFHSYEVEGGSCPPLGRATFSSAFGARGRPGKRTTLALLILGFYIFFSALPFSFFFLVPLRTATFLVPTPPMLFPLRSRFYGELPFFSNYWIGNIVQLGGPMPIGEEVVVEVKTDTPLPLRATTYDYFTGMYWTKTHPDPKQVNLQGNRYQKRPIDPSSPIIRQEITLKQVFFAPLTLPNPYRLPYFPFMLPFLRPVYLLAPLEFCEVIIRSNPSPLGLLEDRDSSLLLIPRGTWPSYEVIAQPNTHWEEEDLSIYLQTVYSPRISALSKKIAEPYHSEEEKAWAIQDFLQRNYFYKLRGNYPSGANAVEWFLFKSKKGDCNFFASAMCIMLREIGIPARVVVGYVPSEYDEEKGAWIARQKDGHMWVEAYIKGKGWCTFDPTPAGEHVPLLTALLERLQYFIGLRKRTLLPLSLFFISIIVLLLLVVMDAQISLRKRRTSPEETLINLYLLLCKKLARGKDAPSRPPKADEMDTRPKGACPIRRESDTLREWFFSAYPFLPPSCREKLGRITDICEKVCYYKDVPSGDLNWAIETLRRILREKEWKKTSIY